MWYSHTMKCYTPLKMNQLQLHTSTWMNLRSNVEWENQVKEEYKVWFLYVNMEKNKSILFRNTSMAPHSSTLAWKIPWTEEPVRLQSMGSLRVRHDWATSLSLFTFMRWRRKWRPTPLFLPGESQGRGGLVGCHLWGRTELDTTEVT